MSGIFNVGTGKARSFRDLMTAVFTALGKPPNIEYVDMPEPIRDTYQYFTQADTRNLRGAGFSANFLSLEDGVKRYVRRYLDRADPEKGRFRAFLLTSMKFFLADEADRNRAQKRGGGTVLSLEFSSGEDRYQREPAHDETPERIFERRWALSVLDRVVERLRSEFVHHGRPEHFERLKVFLLGQSEAPYAALAGEMNTSEGALKVAIHRLRKRYRELFRQEIADTVADPAEVESELRFLAAVLTRK